MRLKNLIALKGREKKKRDDALTILFDKEENPIGAKLPSNMEGLRKSSIYSLSLYLPEDKKKHVAPGAPGVPGSAFEVALQYERDARLRANAKPTPLSFTEMSECSEHGDESGSEGGQGDMLDGLDATEVEEEDSEGRDSSNESSEKEDQWLGKPHSSDSAVTISVAAYSNVTDGMQKDDGSIEVISSEKGEADEGRSVRAEVPLPVEEENVSLGDAIDHLSQGESEEDEAMRVTKALLNLVILSEGGHKKEDAAALKKMRVKVASAARKISLVPEGDENEMDEDED